MLPPPDLSPIAQEVQPFTGTWFQLQQILCSTKKKYSSFSMNFINFVMFAGLDSILQFTKCVACFMFMWI